MNLNLVKIQALYAFLSRLSKREKLIFYLSVFFVSLTLLDRLVISPVSSKMRALDKEIQDKETGIKRDIKILAQKDRIAAESTKYNSFLDKTKSEEEETSSLLKEIESLAGKSTVYLIDMKPGGVKEVGQSMKYLVNLNCEAQMEQLVDFMYDIENSLKLLIIEKYEISPKTRESSVARCSMTVSKIAAP